MVVENNSPELTYEVYGKLLLEPSLSTDVAEFAEKAYMSWLDSKSKGSHLR